MRGLPLQHINHTSATGPFWCLGDIFWMDRFQFERGEYVWKMITNFEDVTQDAHYSQAILLVFYNLGQMARPLPRGSELSTGSQSVGKQSGLLKCTNVPEK